jgi:hypothetical protein
MQYTWTCKCCGKQFNELPTCFHIPAPDLWMELTEAEQESRGEINEDFCFLDEHIFIRGMIEIPIIGEPEQFAWDIWVSVTPKSFNRYVELSQGPEFAEEPPVFGWLCNNIPTYPGGTQLKTHVHFRSGGFRPVIELEPTDHPLAVERRNGIPLCRVEEIVTLVMPRH